MASIVTDRLDGLNSATAIKGPCRVATTANITLSGLQTVDGVSLAADDRVLVKNQTSSVDNGIYIVATGLWRRSKDFAGNRDVKKGTQVFVTSGTTYAESVWYVTSADPITIDTTAITFVASFTSFGRSIVAAADADEARTALSAASLAGNTFTGVQLLPSGSLAAPALSFSSDTDTGIYRIGANEIGIVSGGILQLRTSSTRSIMPLAQSDGARLEVQKHSSPASYSTLRGAMVVQAEQLVDQASSGVFAEGLLVTLNKDFDGPVTLGPPSSSQSVNPPMRVVVTNTGDGSLPSYHGTTSVYAIGATGYNEGGGFSQIVQNVASTNCILSGVEVLLRDSIDAGVTDFDTEMHYDGNGDQSDLTNGTTSAWTGHTGRIGQNGSGQPYGGYIAEIVSYSVALSDTDREKLEGYLAHKWGLEGNLPGGHPYKAAPP